MKGQGRRREAYRQLHELDLIWKGGVHDLVERAGSKGRNLRA